MFDPRSLAPGTFFVWNKETNDLFERGQVRLRALDPSTPRTVVGNSLNSFGVNGLSVGDLEIVETKINGEFKTVLEDSIRQTYDQTITGLAGYVREQKRPVAEGGSGLTERQVKDIFKPSESGYRTVVVRAVERPGDFSVRSGKQEGSDSSATFRVKLPGADIVTISASTLSTADCGVPEGGDQNNRPVCFIEVYVLDPFLKEDGNIDWGQPETFDQMRLSEAFRSL
ncbi:hypothetical protein ACROSR_16940 [Roseovarius tibetensis]|uniref:hypothetical protein n=1 Tax=Roseovarius tibetensis TaxID=2685897 RepID=UPI003D7FB880